MAGKGINGMVPTVSKLYCSTSEVTLVVRKRPHVVYGGGFVVSDFSQKVIFRVDGCGILGKRGELILRDGDGEPLLVIRRKGGMREALGVNRKWEGHVSGYEGSKKLVFKLKEPNSCFTKNNPITVSTEPRSCGTRWDFEIKGYFQDKSCSILDSLGNIVAQVGVKQEIEELMSGSKDLYHVVVKPGIDQAFVFGVITVLDYIYRGSSKC